MPFSETEKVDTQLTFYAATKKANESMAAFLFSFVELTYYDVSLLHSLRHLGRRPDLIALFKFVAAILEDRPIDIYNNGNMYRDFTYVEDLVLGIRHLIEAVPECSQEDHLIDGDSLSPVAPYRIVNIENSKKIKLLDFIEEIEDVLGKKAIPETICPCKKGTYPQLGQMPHYCMN